MGTLRSNGSGTALSSSSSSSYSFNASLGTIQQRQQREMIIWRLLASTGTRKERRAAAVGCIMGVLLLATASIFFGELRGPSLIKVNEAIMAGEHQPLFAASQQPSQPPSETNPPLIYAIYGQSARAPQTANLNEEAEAPPLSAHVVPSLPQQQAPPSASKDSISSTTNATPTEGKRFFLVVASSLFAPEQQPKKEKTHEEIPDWRLVQLLRGLLSYNTSRIHFLSLQADSSSKQKAYQAHLETTTNKRLSFFHESDEQDHQSTNRYLRTLLLTVHYEAVFILQSYSSWPNSSPFSVFFREYYHLLQDSSLQKDLSYGIQSSLEPRIADMIPEERTESKENGGGSDPCTTLGTEQQRTPPSLSSYFCWRAEQLQLEGQTASLIYTKLSTVTIVTLTSHLHHGLVRGQKMAKREQRFAHHNSDILVRLPSAKSASAYSLSDEKTIGWPFLLPVSSPASSPAFEERAGLLFVGPSLKNMSYSGLRWFLEEVYPLLPKNISADLQLTVVGSSDDLHPSLANPAGVTILSLEALTSSWTFHLNRVKLLIVPPGITSFSAMERRSLSSAHTVLLQAMAHGLPILSSSLGLDSSLSSQYPFLEVDVPKQFASALELLYGEKGAWEKASAQLSGLYSRRFEEQFLHSGTESLLQRISDLRKRKQSQPKKPPIELDHNITQHYQAYVTFLDDETYLCPHMSIFICFVRMNHALFCGKSGTWLGLWCLANLCVPPKHTEN